MNARLNTCLANLALAVTCGAALGCSDPGLSSSAWEDAAGSGTAAAKVAPQPLRPSPEPHSLPPLSPAREQRMRVVTAIDDAILPCDNFIFYKDRPIVSSPPPEVVQEAKRVCGGLGARIERARALALDEEQRLAVSDCSAAYREYEILQEERLQAMSPLLRISSIRGQSGHRERAIEAMFDICDGRLKELAS